MFAQSSRFVLPAKLRTSAAAPKGRCAPAANAADEDGHKRNCLGPARVRGSKGIFVTGAVPAVPLLTFLASPRAPPDLIQAALASRAGIKGASTDRSEVRHERTLARFPKADHLNGEERP